MRHYTPLYGNPASDRLFGIARGDILQNPAESDIQESEIVASEAIYPEGVVEGELEGVWSLVSAAFQNRYGMELTAESFDALDTNFRNGFLQSMVDNESELENNDEAVEVLADMIAEEMGIETAGDDVDDLEDLEDESRTFDLAIDVVANNFSHHSDKNGYTDMIAVVADALDNIEAELDVIVAPVEINNAIVTFKTIGFPEYSAEELVEILAITAQGNDLLIDLEKEEMLSDDSRDDAICSDKANNIILARFGEAAAAKHKELCALSPAERMSRLDQNGGSLAAVLGIPSADWEEFVLDSIDNIITPELLEQEGKALSSAVKEVVKGAVNNKDALKTSSRGVLSTEASATGGEVKPLTTTGKIISGVAVAGLVLGGYHFIKKVREF